MLAGTEIGWQVTGSGQPWGRRQCYAKIAGAECQKQGNGGGYMVNNRLLCHSISCDSSHTNLAKHRRNGALLR